MLIDGGLFLGLEFADGVVIDAGTRIAIPDEWMDVAMRRNRVTLMVAPAGTWPSIGAGRDDPPQYGGDLADHESAIDRATTQGTLLWALGRPRTT